MFNSQIDVKANSDLKHAKELLAAEKKNKKTLEKNIVDDQSQLQTKEKELKNLRDLLVKLEEKSQDDNKAVKAAQDHFHAVSAGLSSNEGGEDKTLADQIMSELTRNNNKIIIILRYLLFVKCSFWCFIHSL